MKAPPLAAAALLAAAAVAAAAAAAAAQPPEAPEPVDPDNCLWVLNLDGLIHGTADLKVQLVRTDGRFRHGIGWSAPWHVRNAWNISAHEVRPMELYYGEGALTGQLTLRLFPDPWIPGDGDTRPRDGSVMIEGLLTDPSTREDHALQGSFSGTLDGRPTQGVLRGELKPHPKSDPLDFSTGIRIQNGWINDYAPLGKRLALGLTFRDGRAVQVKLGTLGVWSRYFQITHFDEAPEADWELQATPWGFGGRVSFTRYDYTATNTVPARYDFDLQAVRAAGHFQGTAKVTMKREGQELHQTGWFDGEWESPWIEADEDEDPQPTRTVEVELVEKCDQPREQDMAPYTEAIGVYVYRVLKVEQGTLPGEQIAVAHWVTKRLLAQPVTHRDIGTRATLRICPLDNVRRSIQTVYRSEAPGALGLDYYFDCDQELVYPEGNARRWAYRVGASPKIRLMFLLRDQLKLATLGDCQAWYANRAELMMGEQNRKIPVALNLCQKRSGLVFQKLMIETYLMRLPKLEWIVITWNPRWVNASWAEHGVKGRELRRSPGYQYDVAHLDEVFEPGAGKPLTVEAVAASESGGAWRSMPWGWRRAGEGPSGRAGAMAHAEVVNAQKRLGTYVFVPRRWEEFEAVVENVVRNTGIKILVYTQVVHPSSGRFEVKDKLGTDAPHYRHQVRLMRDLEAEHRRRFFFYDLNNEGHNGLEPGDFNDIDHVSGRGARRVSERVELYRLEIERLLSLHPEPRPRSMAAKLAEYAEELRYRDVPRIMHAQPTDGPVVSPQPGRAAFEKLFKQGQAR